MSDIPLEQRTFIQGYACALSTLVKSHDIGVPIEDALLACGLTSVEILKRNNVCSYDIKILRPLIKEIERKTK